MGNELKMDIMQKFAYFFLRTCNLVYDLYFEWVLADPSMWNFKIVLLYNIDAIS